MKRRNTSTSIRWRACIAKAVICFLITTYVFYVDNERVFSTHYLCISKTILTSSFFLNSV